MGTSSDKLAYLSDTKVAIHDAIVAKGVTIQAGTTFRNYAAKIIDILSGQSSLVDDWSQEYYDAIYSYAQSSWVRPAEWMPMPSMAKTDQRISMLFAVENTEVEGVWFTLSSTNGCVVDWGDGTIDTIASGANVTASHVYSYSNQNLTDTSATLGYKQAMINVTVSSGNITSFKLGSNNAPTNFYGSGYTYNASYDAIQNIKEIKCSLPNVSGASELIFGGTNSIIAVEKITCIAHSVTSAGSMFAELHNLEIIDMDLSSISTYASCFWGCRKLKTVPPLNTTSSANYSGTFYGCLSLITIPPVHSANNINNMFYGCSSVQYLPTVKAKVSSTQGIPFNACSSLKKLSIDITSTTAYDLSGLLVGCVSLQKVNIIAWDTTSYASAFSGLTSLETITGLTNNTKTVTNVSNMFNGCSSLKEAPLFNTASATTFSAMFLNCVSLRKIPAYSMQAATTVANFCANSYAIVSILAPVKFSISIANFKLSATALNDLFAALPTVTGQTLTVTGNPGAATCDTSIATAKGWSVIK